MRKSLSNRFYYNFIINLSYTKKCLKIFEPNYLTKIQLFQENSIV